MKTPLEHVLERYGLASVSEATIGPVPHQTSSQLSALESQAAERKGWYSLAVGGTPGKPDRTARIPEADYLVLKSGGMTVRG